MKSEISKDFTHCVYHFVFIHLFFQGNQFANTENVEKREFLKRMQHIGQSLHYFTQRVKKKELSMS